MSSNTIYRSVIFILLTYTLSGCGSLNIFQSDKDKHSHSLHQGPTNKKSHLGPESRKGESSPSQLSHYPCKILKHPTDHLFRIEIKGMPINKNYYIYDEANKITHLLKAEGKCK